MTLFTFSIIRQRRTGFIFKNQGYSKQKESLQKKRKIAQFPTTDFKNCMVMESVGRTLQIGDPNCVVYAKNAFNFHAMRFPFQLWMKYVDREFFCNLLGWSGFWGIFRGWWEIDGLLFREYISEILASNSKDNGSNFESEILVLGFLHKKS